MAYWGTEIRLVCLCVALLLSLSGSIANAESDQRGALDVSVSDRYGNPLGKQRFYSKSYALVIGIDDYRDSAWPSLSKAKEDAQAVALELIERGFDVVLETDLNASELQHSIRKFMHEKGADPEARLFIWFAGHGHTIKNEHTEAEVGYLVPSDAPDPGNGVGFLSHALPLVQFNVWLQQINAKHLLVVFDSCFSGSILSGLRAGPPPFILEAAALPVRMFISSGKAGQKVRDDGFFRRAFITALSEGDLSADGNRDGYVTGTELGAFLQMQVANYTNNAQTPQFAKWKGFKQDLGDFVFAVDRLDTNSEEDLAPVVEAIDDPILEATNSTVEEANVIPTSADPEHTVEQGPDITDGSATRLPSEEDLVFDIQKELVALGYDVGAIDGKYGPNTKKALNQFYQDIEIEVPPKLEDLDLGQLQSLNPPVLSGCLKLRVQVDERDSGGSRWDEWNGVYGDPDIIITDKVTGRASPECSNTYTCNWQADVRLGEIHLSLIDSDANDDDTIGSGICSTDKRACRLGHAKIALLGSCEGF